jgi:P27 family predicted phage terminase small subunit
MPQTLVEPRAPEGIDDASAGEWRRITTLLRSRGTLDALDETPLREYLTCWRRLREAEATLDAEGLLVSGSNGGTVRNPASMIAHQYRSALLAWSKELGLTPLSRLRMPMRSEAASENRFSRLAKGAK